MITIIPRVCQFGAVNITRHARKYSWLYLLRVLLSIPFNKLPWRKVVTLSPRLFWTRLDLQLYPFLFTLSFVHVTHCYPLLMTVLSLKYNFESIQDLYIRLTKIHFIFFFICLTKVIKRVLFEQGYNHLLT